MARLLVIGLDALSPDLVERWRPELPNLGHLMQHGIYGPLESIAGHPRTDSLHPETIRLRSHSS